MTINRVIRTLIYSDIAIVTGFSLYGPIFAIFILEQIKGGGPIVAGLAVSIYWTVRSIIQLPISRYLDSHDGERDDFWALVGGSFLFSVVPLMYLFASEPWHVFLIQAVYGIGDSLAIPTYLSIYGRHVDKSKEGSEWAMRSVVVGVGAAIAGATGGFLAATFGFRVIFIITSILSIVGSSVLLGLHSYMSRRMRGGVHGKIVPPVKGHGH